MTTPPADNRSDTPKLTRRQAVGRVGTTLGALTALGAGTAWLHNRVDPWAPPPAVELARFAVERPALSPVLAIAHGDDVGKMVQAAVAEMGGIETFLNPQDRVLIKPNVAFDRPPSLGATTHPDTLRAVIEVVKQAGVQEIMVTDNPINSPAGCFFKSGIQAAAEQAGVRVFLPRPSAFEDVAIGGEVLGRWPMLYEPIRWATKIIGVAPLKDHNLCSASVTMKNWYGFLGGRRNQFHQAIHEVIADLAFMMAPTLVFLDATRMLIRNGPTGGALSDVKPGQTVVCGTDAVAVDAYGITQLLERTTEQAHYLEIATARGIGSADWKNLVHREVQVS